MELLYLWIEDYRNIKNQGFNFSNHFLFSFDLKANKLTCKVNEEAISDLYGENILNVTGVIGKNGSGKSNLFDFIIAVLSINTRSLRNFAFEQGFIALFKKENYIYPLISSGKILLGEKVKIPKTIAQFTVEPIDTIAYQSGVRHQALPQFSNKLDTEFNLASTVYYSPSLDFRKSEALDMYKKDRHEYYEKVNFINISTNYLIEHEKNGDLPPLEAHRFNNMFRQLQLLSNYFEIEPTFKLPPKLLIQFFIKDIGKKKVENSRRQNPNSILGFFLNTESGILPKLKSRLISESLNVDQNNIQFKKLVQQRVLLTFLIALLWDFIRSKWMYNEGDGLEKQEEYIKQLNSKADVSFTKVEDVKQLVRNFFINKFRTENEYYKEHESIFLEFFDTSEKIFDSLEVPSVEFNQIGEVKGIILSTKPSGIEFYKAYDKYLKIINLGTPQYPTPVLPDFGYYHKGFFIFDRRDISSGEKAIWDLYSRIWAAKQEIIFQSKPSISGGTIDKKVIYLILDEGEIGFHPQWQREYLDKVVSFLVKMFKDYSIQLFLSSHSPFLVSDLPNQNLIYLDKSGNGNCHVLRRENIASFGANIYDLFLDSFFLSQNEANDYIMGQFAYKKINETIAWLNRPKTDEDVLIAKNYLAIIKSIGEPVLSRKLTEMFSSKMGIEYHQQAYEAELRKLKRQLQDKYNIEDD